ncbi:MAG: hypothetical protein LZ158_04090 [Thaumarchaeota archaeon]|jgi:hypothetical protein|nr:hypothetical protein [Candidatus Terraquivivens yellowstonensis]MCL7387909.1 hypothetical protein [Candidatus Terraquivivens yellowstonensis]MCL7393071.1 hypothetical protein [Candidatus Terraquivivens yellowstonensis]MCL7395577.1 hypothetical protein [Candidatus Terraquivivens yellowstonensis]MCL7398499.1 hypothetical protein [Candidatus Terraquivivens yellowstonensis]
MARLIAGFIIGIATLTLASVVLFTGNSPPWPEPASFQLLILSVLLQAYTALLAPMFTGFVSGGDGLICLIIWAVASALAGLIAGKLSASIKLALLIPSSIILLWLGLIGVVFSEVYAPQFWLVKVNTFIENLIPPHPFNLVTPYLIVLVFSGMFGFLSSTLLTRKETVAV